MPKIKRVGHLVINVKDQEASTKFYTEVLGLEISINREGFGTFLTCGKIHHDLALFQAAPDAAPVTMALEGMAFRHVFTLGVGIELTVAWSGPSSWKGSL